MTTTSASIFSFIIVEADESWRGSLACSIAAAVIATTLALAAEFFIKSLRLMPLPFDSLCLTIQILHYH
jgi:hypothetical protein